MMGYTTSLRSESQPTYIGLACPLDQDHGGGGKELVGSLVGRRAIVQYSTVPSSRGPVSSSPAFAGRTVLYARCV